MKRILYIPSHDEMQLEEIRTLESIGFEVFNTDNPRTDNDLYKIFLRYHTPGHRIFRLNHDFVQKFDIIIACHFRENLILNMNKFDNKLVVLRSIGCNHPNTEEEIKNLLDLKVKVVRCSPNEKHSKNFAGEHAIIRIPVNFAKYYGWHGTTKKVLTIGGNLSSRPNENAFHIYDNVVRYFDTHVEEYGASSKQYRVCFAVPDKPFPLSYGFIQAFAAGIPVVTMGPKYGSFAHQPHVYEQHKLIQNGENGYWSDNVDELKLYIRKLLFDENLARKVSFNGRQTAAREFGSTKIGNEWKAFFKEYLK